jgi:hypothetical protein
MMFRGSPSQGRAKLAFFNLNNIVLEIIEPIGGLSTWSKFLEKHGAVSWLMFRSYIYNLWLCLLAVDERQCSRQTGLAALKAFQ